MAKKAPIKTKGGSTPPVPSTSGLKPQHERFVLEYLIDGNAAKAYTRAGYSAAGNSARTNAARLLANADIQAFLRKAQQKVAAQVELTGQMVVERLRDMLLADPRELVEYHVHCCRHCHGKDFAYQWTAPEFERAMQKFEDESAAGGKRADRATPPDPSGGMGFDARKGPHKDCPECLGNGHGRSVFKDTRYLSPGAAMLYAGTKQTKDGVEVKITSQLEVYEKLMRHLGLYEKDNEQTQPQVRVVVVPAKDAQ